MCKVVNKYQSDCHNNWCRQQTMLPSAKITGHLMHSTGFAALLDLVSNLLKRRKKRRRLHKRRGSSV